MEEKIKTDVPENDRLKRLAHVGKLSAGIGHNIMTPLSLIMMNSDLLTMKVSGHEELLKHVTEITDQASQISRLAENMMWKVSMEEQETPSLLQVGALVEQNLQFWMGDMFFKHRLEKKFQINTQTPPLQGVPYHFTSFMDEWILGVIERGRPQEGGNFRVVVDCPGENSFFILFEDTFPPPGERETEALRALTAGTTPSPTAFPALQRLLSHHPAEVTFRPGEENGGSSLRLMWRL